jgi:hypothetical protein
MEPLEHLLAMLFGYAHTGVADPPSTDFNVRAISPSNVNLYALESRFNTIFSHMLRST